MQRFAASLSGLWTVLLTVTLVAQTSSAASPVEAEIAAEADRQIDRHLAEASVTSAPQAPDEDFLRRVHLDLAGGIPSPAQVKQFTLDTNPNKRRAVIDELLAAPEFAETWASYWKDVVYLRATEQRSRQTQPVFREWLETQFAANRPWHEMTRDMLTATGSTLENGATGLVFAQGGEPDELAAEISRVFLGIQISCANCHDHPTDSWKRQQFHELAAFLPRITVRPQDVDGVRTFFVQSMDELPGRGGRRGMLAGPAGQPPDADRIFRQFDRNRDGKLAKAEVTGPLVQQFDRLLQNGDADKDGLLSREEFVAARTQVNTQPGRGSSEYYMPDLNNPASQGKLITPGFFLTSVHGPKLKVGSEDQQRREALADYVTSPNNPWFARAFVNRVWAEMLGTGFYMPIDDMGPQRTAVYDDVLETLSKGFVASNHDIKWLYRTIANTQAYQRKMSSAEAYPAPFASVSPTRLRGDQIFNSITQVLGEPLAGRGGRGQRGAMQGVDPNRAAQRAARRGAAGNPEPAPGNAAAQPRGNAPNVPNLAATLPGSARGDNMEAGGEMNSMNAGNSMSAPPAAPVQNPPPGARGGMGLTPAERQLASFTELFGFDPSTPQEDLLGTIPQALYMMNAPQVDRRILSFGVGKLAAISRQNPRSEDALREVYLLTLSRAPTEKEMAINLAYIRQVGGRSEALEDIQWSLMNSTEFVSKR